MRNLIRYSSLTLVLSLQTLFAKAEEAIGTIKTLKGSAVIERSGRTLDASLGNEVYRQDRILTSADGSVGVLFLDDSRVAVGPNSAISLEQFAFDPSTHDGRFNVSMQKGTLSAIAGKLTEKTPGAMTVKTPAAILAVRGTEFSIKVDPAQE